MTEKPSDHDVTELLRRWSEGGDRDSLDRLIPLVSDELRRIAGSVFIQERSDHTLQPTALVNEAYMRLVDRKQATWESRIHFFSFAARTMRRILVDHARRHRAEKRGADAQRVPLEDASAVELQRGVDLLALDAALTHLSEMDARQGRIVELRYFAGLKIDEIATVMEIGQATVNRDLAMARAWLKQELAEPPP